MPVFGQKCPFWPTRANPAKRRDEVRIYLFFLEIANRKYGLARSLHTEIPPERGLQKAEFPSIRLLSFFEKKEET